MLNFQNFSLLKSSLNGFNRVVYILSNALFFYIPWLSFAKARDIDLLEIYGSFPLKALSSSYTKLLLTFNVAVY